MIQCELERKLFCGSYNVYHLGKFLWVILRHIYKENFPEQYKSIARKKNENGIVEQGRLHISQESTLLMVWRHIWKFNHLAMKKMIVI